MRFSILVLSFLFATAPASAEVETPWQNHQDMVRTRLIVASGEFANDDGAMLGWEAELAPGWKTYWRSPGEAGLPVRLSVREQAVELLYPLPERFELFGLETYGYGNKVIIPFRLAAGSGGQEETLAAVDFMICKDICVPIEARYDMTGIDLAPPLSSHDIRFEAWLSRVPSRTDATPAGLKILSAKVTGTVGHQRLVVDAEADVNLTDADVMAEVNDMVHFGAPQRHLLEDGRKIRFVLPAMTGNKPFDLKGQQVRLSFSDGKGHAIDRSLGLAP